MPHKNNKAKEKNEQNNSSMLDNLEDIDLLDPIEEDEDRRSIYSMPSLNHYAGNEGGLLPFVASGQSNEVIGQEIQNVDEGKEDQLPVNEAPKELPPVNEAPKEQLLQNQPQVNAGQEGQPAQNQLQINAGQEGQPAQNVPQVVAAPENQPVIVPEPQNPLGPIWNGDEVVPDMIAEKGGIPLKKVKVEQPNDNINIMNEPEKEFSFEGLDQIGEEDEQHVEQAPPQNDLIPEFNHQAKIKPRTKPYALRQATDNFALAAGHTFGVPLTLALSPFSLTYYAYSSIREHYAKKKMQEKKNYDTIPGWNGAKYEKKMDESGADILLDQRRVPTVWSRNTAAKADDGNGNPKPPEVSVYFEQPNLGSSKTFGGKYNAEMGHTMIGIDYSRYSRETRRYERYGMRYGFYMAGGFNNTSAMHVMTNHHAKVPGALNDDWGHPYTVSRRYPAEPRQVNSIVKASETYAEGGYNYFTRNCTTFVKEMIVDVAHLDTGGKIFEQEDVRYNLTNNLMRSAGNAFDPWLSTSFRGDIRERSKQNDLSYQGYGNKRVTKEDLKNYNDTNSLMSLSSKTYIPAVGAENARRLSGKNSGVLGSFYYVRNLGKSPADAAVSPSLLSKAVEDEALDLSGAVANLYPQYEEMGLAPPEGYIDAKIKIQSLKSGIDFLTADMAEVAVAKGLNKDTAPLDDLLRPESLREAHDKITENIRTLNELYRDVFKMDERLFISVSKVLSLLELSIRFIDNSYDSISKKSVAKGDSGDIRYQMENDPAFVRTGNIETQFTPSHFESYVQIYGSPQTAVEKYARYQELKEKDERLDAQKDAEDVPEEELEPPMTGAEKKEYSTLSRMDNLADDFDKSHRYLLNKLDYTQQDLDYVFSIKEKMTEGMDLQDNPMLRKRSSSDVYQILILERVFGGMKAAWNNEDNKGLSDETISNITNNPSPENTRLLEVWLDNYLIEKAENKQDFIKMILRGMLHAKQGYTKESLLTAFQSMVGDKYIETAFSPDNLGAITDRSVLGNQQLFPTLQAIFSKNNYRFPQLIKNLVDEVLAEGQGHEGENAAAQQPVANVPAQQPNANIPALQPGAQAGEAAPVSTDKLKEQLKKGAKAYAKFLERQKKDGFYTKKQLEERRKQFLDNYYNLCEDYCRRQKPDRIWSSLPSETYTLFIHVAHAFPGSYVQQVLRERGAIVEPENGRNAGKRTRREIDLKAKVEMTHENRMAELAVNSDVQILEGDRKETESQKGLKEGVSELQTKGLRAIMAYLYQHTKEHATFVEGIDNRTPREKLLIFYLLEKEKTGAPTHAEVIESQRDYVPNVNIFKEKIRYRKHWYKFGGTNINWDLISSAVSMTYSMRDMIGDIGNGKLPALEAANIPAIEPDLSFSSDNNLIKNDIIRNDNIKNENIKNDDINKPLIDVSEDEKDIIKKNDSSRSLLDIPLNENNDKNAVLMKESNRRFNIILSIAENINRKSSGSSSLSDSKNNNIIEKSDNNILLRNSRSSLDDLNKSLEDLDSLFAGIDFGKEQVPNLSGNDGKSPGKPTGFNKVGANTQDTNKYFTLMHTFCGTGLKLLKSLKGENILDFSKGITDLQWEGMTGDAAAAVMNIILLIVNFRNVLNSFGTEQWEETFMKTMSLLQTFGNTAKSGFTATTGTAGLIFNAGWGLNGTTETAKTLTSVASYGGIALGSMTTGVGLGNMIVAGTRRKRTTDVEKSLNEARENSKSPELEGKRQILQNVIAANRAAQKRTQKSAALQMIQGGLNTASGSLALSAGATLGLSGIAALGLSGAALVVGIGNVIYQKKSKKGEMTDVIDRYLNTNKLLYDFLKKHNKDGSKKSEERIRKKFGTQDQIREMIRQEAEALLGYPSHKKMYSAIMWKYSNTLYDMVFKKDGKYITEAERANEKKSDNRASKERQMYADMLKAYGFKVKYPNKQGEEPKPGLSAIYKKFTA